MTYCAARVASLRCAALESRTGEVQCSLVLGDDNLDGGPGIDTASWADDAPATGRVTASLPADSASDDTLGTDSFVENLDGTDTVENLTGGPNDDTLTGNSMANVLTGGDGADDLFARGGADILLGGAGTTSCRAWRTTTSWTEARTPTRSWEAGGRIP
jgi:Ca2+-binding RTX toxin-like protein